MKHVLSLQEMDEKNLYRVIENGIKIKNRPEDYMNLCERKGLLMLFQKTSTRTNLSFQSAIHQLGGYAVNMDWDASNFAISPIQFEVQYASRNCDLIMARLKKHSDLLELAQYSRVPVINGCCNRYHPCQALADLMTIYEMRGTFEGVTLTYVGIHNNVANSLIAGCLTLGINLIVVTPIINDASWDQNLMQTALKSGKIKQSNHLQEAIAQSEFVYTDTWIDMEHFNDQAYQQEKERRIATMMPYQLNKKLFLDHQPYIMHDMPIHPGFEIEEALIESDQSVIYQQAENRMHVQKALIISML